MSDTPHCYNKTEANIWTVIGFMTTMIIIALLLDIAKEIFNIEYINIKKYYKF